MTKLAIDSAFFTDHAGVMRDIAKTGYWPTTYVSNQSPELPVHHHDYNIIGYVLSGSGYLLDEQAQRVEIKAGDRLRIPKGAAHAEGAVTTPMVYIVTVDEPVGLTRALMPRNLRGPMPDLTELNVLV